MRTYLVTGSASGIGRATVARLKEDGHHVIGADIHNAEIIADLSTHQGRVQLVEEASTLSGGTIDGVLAVAGTAAPSAVTVAVNYYGALATLESLRPLLAKSNTPRAAVVTSYAAIGDIDSELLGSLQGGSEQAALERAEAIREEQNDEGGFLVYTTAKRALSLWVRAHAATDEWAKQGIALNAVAPGLIATPMTASATDSPEALAALDATSPAPYGGPAGAPSAVASLLSWLTSPENTFVTGQVVYIDGGAESARRPQLF